MTMPGSPCVYYGTETAIAGEVQESHNRRCMPWREIDGGKFDGIISEFRKIVGLRKTFTEFKHGDIEWKLTDNDRLVDYVWTSGGKRMEVVVNATEKSLPLAADGKVIYGRKLDGDTILSGGIAVICR